MDDVTELYGIVPQQHIFLERTMKIVVIGLGTIGMNVWARLVQELTADPGRFTLIGVDGDIVETRNYALLQIARDYKIPITPRMPKCHLARAIAIKSLPQIPVRSFRAVDQILGLSENCVGLVNAFWPTDTTIPIPEDTLLVECTDNPRQYRLKALHVHFGQIGDNIVGTIMYGDANVERYDEAICDTERAHMFAQRVAQRVVEVVRPVVQTGAIQRLEGLQEVLL